MGLERNQWMDIAKGITIMLMVLGHTSIPDVGLRFIWSFHMPLFFIASGWMTNWGRYSFGEFFAKKAKSIILPFVVYSAIVLLIIENLIGGGQSDELADAWLGGIRPVVHTSFVTCLGGRTVGVYDAE